VLQLLADLLVAIFILPHVKKAWYMFFRREHQLIMNSLLDYHYLFQPYLNILVTLINQASTLL